VRSFSPFDFRPSPVLTLARINPEKNMSHSNWTDCNSLLSKISLALSKPVCAIHPCEFSSSLRLRNPNTRNEPRRLRSNILRCPEKSPSSCFTLRMRSESHARSDMRSESHVGTASVCRREGRRKERLFRVPQHCHADNRKTLLAKPGQQANPLRIEVPRAITNHTVHSGHSLRNSRSSCSLRKRVQLLSSTVPEKVSDDEVLHVLSTP